MKINFKERTNYDKIILIKGDFMKLHSLLATLSVFGLASCGALFEGPNNLLPSSLAEEARRNPDEVLLRSAMRMMNEIAQATETTMDLDLVVASRSTQIRIDEDNNEISNQKYGEDLEIKANATIKTNDLNGNSPQMSLALNIKSVILRNNNDGDLQTTLNLQNQIFEAFYNIDTLYLNFSRASELANLLGNDSTPLKMRSFIGTPEYLGEQLGIEFPPTIDEDEVNSLVEEFAPVLESFPGTTTTISGTDLVITYQVTQTTLAAMVEDGVRALIETSLANVEGATPEDIESFVNEAVETIMSMFTIRMFKLTISVNLLSGLIKSLLVDVDVDITTESNYTDYYDYDYNYLTGEYEYIYVNVQNFNKITIDTTFSMSNETFSENIAIALPPNKEEYEWMTEPTAN